MTNMEKIDLIIKMIESGNITFFDELTPSINAFFEMGEMLSEEDRKIDLNNKLEFLIRNPDLLDENYASLDEDRLYYGDTSCSPAFSIFEEWDLVK